MPRAKTTPAPAKAPGRNIAEHERNTERVTVRLDPEAMALLRHYAAAWKCPMSEVVANALDALDNDRPIKEAMTMLARVTPDRSVAFSPEGKEREP